MAKPSVCADLILQMDWRGLGGDRTHLNRGLYLAIRQAIDSGALLPRSRLPASRDLARELGVSRNTVNHAYEQLQVEGYVRSQVGRGTHVVDTLPAALLRRATAAAPAPGGGLSAQAQALLRTAQASEQQWGAFMPGVPDVTEFPRATYARIHNRLLRHAGPQLLTYGTRGGVDMLCGTGPVHCVVYVYPRRGHGVAGVGGCHHHPGHRRGGHPLLGEPQKSLKNQKGQTRLIQVKLRQPTDQVDQSSTR